MFKWKKAASILVAAAVAGSLAGCGESTATAMTVDGVEIPAGLYIYYSYSAYYELTTQLSEQDSELDTTDDDAVKALEMDGVSTEDWIKDKTMEYCQQYAAILNQCEELGIELEEDEITEIDDTVTSFWESYGDTYEDNGMSSDSIHLMLENVYLEDSLFFYYYDIDGAEGVTEEEVQEYYIENNARVRYIQFDLTDGNGDELDDDGKEDMLDMVTEYLEILEKSEGDEEALMSEMDTIESEYDAYVTSLSEEAAAETATTESGETTTTTTTTTEAETTTAEVEEEDSTETAVADADDDTEETTTTAVEDSADADDTTETTETESTGDTEETTTTTTADPYANETIIARVTTDEDTDEEDLTYSPSESAYDAIFGEEEDGSDALDLNTPILVEDEDAYYLIVRFDIETRMTEDDLWTEDNVDTVLSEKYYDAFEDLLDDWCDAQTVETNDRAIKRYDAFDIELDYS